MGAGQSTNQSSQSGPVSDAPRSASTASQQTPPIASQLQDTTFIMNDPPAATPDNGSNNNNSSSSISQNLTSSHSSGNPNPYTITSTTPSLPQPYSMERSDTLHTVAQGNDEPVVVSDSNGRILRQRSEVCASESDEPALSQSNSHSLIAQEEEQLRPKVQAPSSTHQQPQLQQQPPVGTNRSRTSHRPPASPMRRNNGGNTTVVPNTAVPMPLVATPCLNQAKDVNDRLDTQVEVKVYPCNNNSGNVKKKFSQFSVKPEGVIIQGTNRHRNSSNDIGTEYAQHVGRKLERYELNDTRACQLLVTTHAKSFWVVPAPEAFSRHSGTCRLLGDRKHPLASHTLSVGDFLRVGSVGVVVIETHDGEENRILSEDKIQKIMRDTTSGNGTFLDLGETDGENSEDELGPFPNTGTTDTPVCYMCFDDENTTSNPLITPCKCRGDTRYVHVNCLRKWHTAEADNKICFLSSVDATCSVCKSTFKSDFRLKDGRLVKLFKSSLEPPYVSLLVATKHEMAQRLYNTRFQLSFSTILKQDRKNASRPLQLGRSSGSDMVLDYRTVSARHATVRFKNGEFVFTDAGSSNGSYLYLRRPVELTPSQPVQFRLGRSMISMKVVNKWNRRLLRAVRRTGNGGGSHNVSNVDTIPEGGGAGVIGVGEDLSVGSSEDDVRITNGKDGTFTRNLPRRTRDSIMNSLPNPGLMSQQSGHHLDLLHALAYPKKHILDLPSARKPSVSPLTAGVPLVTAIEGNKDREEMNLSQQIAEIAIAEHDDVTPMR